MATAAPAPLTLADLPALSRFERENNHLFRTKEAFAINTDFGVFNVTLKASSQAFYWHGNWIRIGVTCEGRPNALWVPADLVSEMLRARFPELDVQALDPEQLALIVEIAFRNVLDWATQAGMARAELSHVHQGGEPNRETCLAFDLTLPQGMIVPAFAECHEVERDKILKASAIAPLKREPFPDLRIGVSFRCGYTSIHVSDLGALEVGAGIVLDGTTLSFQKIVAVVAERFAQSCTWATIKPVLDGPILRRAAGSMALYTTGGALSDEAETEAGTASLGDVPVHLVFELGRTEILLTQLETLAQGYVFELGKPLSQSVDILANGKRIASGDLVRIGEGIGVRVTRVIR